VKTFFSFFGEGTIPSESLEKFLWRSFLETQ